MKPTDLPFNRRLGVRKPTESAGASLELPFAPGLENHIETFHAAAQFALAEAAAAECLRVTFPDLVTRALAVVRHAEIRYRAPASGTLSAFPELPRDAAATLPHELAARGQAFVPVEVSLRDAGGQIASHATFKWYISTRQHS